jgi:hypothetical protein
MRARDTVVVILVILFLVWLAAILIGMKYVNSWVHNYSLPLLLPFVLHD